MLTALEYATLKKKIQRGEGTLDDEKTILIASVEFVRDSENPSGGEPG